MPFDNQNFPLPAVETDEVLQRLVRGREKIATGWCQRALVKGHSVCARGALFEATEWSRWRLHADDVARRTDEFLSGFVSKQFQSSWPDNPCISPVVNFNNHPTTTHADVLALFDRAIAARRAAIAST